MNLSQKRINVPQRCLFWHQTGRVTLPWTSNYHAFDQTSNCSSLFDSNYNNVQSWCKDKKKQQKNNGLKIKNKHTHISCSWSTSTNRFRFVLMWWICYGNLKTWCVSILPVLERNFKLSRRFPTLNETAACAWTSPDACRCNSSRLDTCWSDTLSKINHVITW